MSYVVREIICKDSQKDETKPAVRSLWWECSTTEVADEGNQSRDRGQSPGKTADGAEVTSGFLQGQEMPFKAPERSAELQVLFEVKGVMNLWMDWKRE